MVLLSNTVRCLTIKGRTVIVIYLPVSILHVKTSSKSGMKTICHCQKLAQGYSYIRMTSLTWGLKCGTYIKNIWNIWKYLIILILACSRILTSIFFSKTENQFNLKFVYIFSEIRINFVKVERVNLYTLYFRVCRTNFALVSLFSTLSKSLYWPMNFKCVCARRFLSL